jgi:D-lactate dehydrogenase (cytochrome)
LEDASKTVSLLIGSGLDVAALELLTPELIQLMNREKTLGLPEQPTLFCEFHGISRASLNETAGIARELCMDCGAQDFAFGMAPEERSEMWRARHEAWETIHRAHPGMETLIVDAAVPISRYPEMVLYSQRLVDDKQADGYVFGHAGDGNLHVVLVGDPKNKAQWTDLEAINHAIVTRAVELGGTSTGEHGIGIGKRKFMELEHGAGYRLMQQIKMTLDPKNMMNPDKIF